MSVKDAPTCPCAGFNSECFVEPVIVIDPIIPDPTPTPSRTYLSTTNFAINTAVLTNNTSGFLYPIQLSAPANGNSFDAYVFGAGMNMSPTTTQGSASLGSPYSITTPATSCSGAGINSLNMISTPLQNGANIVYQPNLTNPSLTTYWTGTFTINWATQIFTIVNTTTGFNTGIPVGSVIYPYDPPFGCPSSIVISSYASGPSYNITRGTSNTSYYNLSPTLVISGAVQSSLTATGTASVAGNILTTTTTIAGLDAGQYVVFADYTFLILSVKSATTFLILGVQTSFTLPNSTFYSYQMNVGCDVVFNSYSSSGAMVNGAIIRGALKNTSLVGNTGTGGIIFSSFLTTAGTYPVSIGNNGKTQSTSSYPTGLVSYTISPVINASANSFGGSSAVKASANSGGFTLSSFTNEGYEATTTACNLGGITIYWYKLL